MLECTRSESVPYRDSKRGRIDRRCHHCVPAGCQGPRAPCSDSASDSCSGRPTRQGHNRGRVVRMGPVRATLGSDDDQPCCHSVPVQRHAPNGAPKSWRWGRRGCGSGKGFVCGLICVPTFSCRSYQMSSFEFDYNLPIICSFI